MRTVGQRRGAVRVHRRDVVGKAGAGWDLDHVLWPQGADDRVVAAVGAEDDAVGRGQRRDVDGVVAHGAVNGDGTEVQAGAGEVAEHRDGVVPGRPLVRAAAVVGGDIQRVDGDLLDVVELGHHRGRRADGAGDHDLRRRCEGRPERGGKVGVLPGGQRVNAEGLRRGDAVQDVGVGARAAVDAVTPVDAELGDLVIARAAVDDVVAAVPVHGVVGEKRGVGAVGDIVAGCAVEVQSDQGRAGEIVSDDAGGSGEHLLRVALAVGEADAGPEDRADLGLARGEALPRGAGDGVPGHAVSCQDLPAEREGPKAVRVRDAGRGDAEGQALGRRHEPVGRGRIDDDRGPGRLDVDLYSLHVLQLGDDDASADHHGLRVVAEAQGRELGARRGEPQLLDGKRAVEHPEDVVAGAAVDEIAPVAGTPGDGVVPARREDEVVPRPTRERLARRGADHDVHGGRAGRTNGVDVGLADLEQLDLRESVASVALHAQVVGDRDDGAGALEGVGLDRSGDDGRVGAAITIKGVVAVAAGELVVAGPALEPVVARPADQDVIAVVADQDVVAIATVDTVVSVAAVNGVDAGIALDVVVAVQAEDHVRCRRSGHVVVPGRADEGRLDGQRALGRRDVRERAGPGRDGSDLDIRVRRGKAVARRATGCVGHGPVRPDHVPPRAVGAEDLPLHRDRAPGDEASEHGIEPADVAVGGHDVQAVEGLVEDQRDIDRPVREAQLLDVPERVAAVGNEGEAGARVEAAMDDGDRSIGSPHDIVLGDVAAEDRGVDIHASGSGILIIEDLPHDVELDRLDGAAHHQLAQRLAVPLAVERVRCRQVEGLCQAVDGGELVSGRILDADADVEPGVAVDDIVTAAALDGVAALAAEQDVAADESKLLVAGTISHVVDLPEKIGCDDLVEVRDARDAGLVELVADHRVLGSRERWAVWSRFGIRVAAVVAPETVVLVPARERFDRVEAIAQDVLLVGGEDRDEEVGIRGLRVALVDRPVEAEHALAAHHAFALDHDVVAGFGVEIILVGAGEHHVVTDDGRVEEQLGVVAGCRVEAAAALDPVAALVAEQEVAALAAEDEVIAEPAEGFLAVRSGDQDVLALVAEDQRQAAAGVDDIVTRLAMQHVDFADIGAAIGDDIVAGAAMDLVDAVAGLDPVIAFAAPDGVVAAAGDDDVIARRALDQEMVGGVDAHGARDLSDAEAADCEHSVAGGVLGEGAVRVALVFDQVAVGVAALDEGRERLEERVLVDGLGHRELHLVARIHIDDVVGNREDVTGQGVARRAEIGVVQHHLGEGVVLEFVEEVQALDARQVVEAVAVLQVLELQLEHEGEGRAEHAAEGHLLLGQATDPEIDVVQATELRGVLPAAVQEVLPVSLVQRRVAEDELHRRVALCVGCRRARDRLVRAIGRDEVHDRGRVLQVEGEVGPARIGVELAVAIGYRLELRACLVQRGDAGIAAAGDVDRGKVERDADELVAQDMRDEFIDLVADLAGHAAHDRAGGLVVVEHDLLTVRAEDRGSVRVALHAAEGERVQECVEQGEVARRAVGIGLGDILAQHRMAEAIDDMRELGEDGRVDVGRGIEDEGVDIRLDLAGELLEDEVLVLHLGREAGGLEQALAVPLQGGDRGRIRRKRGRVDAQPLVQEGEVVRLERPLLDLLDHVVVFRVEHVVHRRETDILVAAPVAGDVVRIEQFVVIGEGHAGRVGYDRIARDVVSVRLLHHGIGRAGIPVGIDEALEDGVVGDVVDEGVAGAQRSGRGNEQEGIALDEDIVAATEGVVIT